MSGILRHLRACSDPTRLRLLALLHQEQLSVAELQEVTGLGQSRISTHLGLLHEAGLVESRRKGKRAFYRLIHEENPVINELMKLVQRGAAELPEHDDDAINLKRVLHLREDTAQIFFNQVAGRFDRSYGPGRSWQALGQLLLRLLPPLEVADLGSGEGLISELLARNCHRVIAVDNSEKIIEYGAQKARRNRIRNLEFRLGDLEDPPLEKASVDVAILSQALHHASQPDRALRSAHRILRPGGRILILELLKHDFEKARELYGDHWLGFTESQLHRWLEEAGFNSVSIQAVAREEQPPHFTTLLATAMK